MGIRKIWKSGRGGKLALIACAAFLLYSVLGAFVLPIVVEHAVEGEVSERLGRRIEIEDVDFNPFTVSLEIEGITVEDDYGERFFEAGLIRTNFQLSTLVTWRVSFKELSMVDGRAFVQVEKDGSLNFERIFESEDSEEVVEEDDSVFQFWVGKLAVENFVLSFEDQSLESVFRQEVGPVSFVAKNFHNKEDATSPYSFDMLIGEQTKIAWEGRLGLVPLFSEGNFRIEGVDVSKGKPYWESLVEVGLSSMVDLEGHYSLKQEDSGEIEFFLDNTHMGIGGFRLDDTANPDSFIAWDTLSVDGVTLDYENQSIGVRSVALGGLEIEAVLDEEGALLMPRGELMEQSGDISGESNVEAVDHDEEEWQLVIDSFVLKDGSVAMRDRSLGDPELVPLSVNEIGVEAQSISISDSELPMNAKLTMSINSNGRFSANISGNIPRDEFKGDYLLSGLDLSSFQSYLDLYANVDLRSGKLASKGDFSSVAGRFEALSSLDLTEFDLVEKGTSLPVARWDRLDVSGFEYDDTRALVERVTLENAYFNVEQGEEGTNLDRVLLEGEISEEVEPGEGVEEESFPYEVKHFVMTNGQLDFKDTTFPDTFITGLRNAQVEVSDLSSDPEKTMAVELSSTLEGGSGFTLKGELLPSDYRAYSDFEIEMNAYDLVSSEPYWKKFLGRELDSGELTVSSRYELKDNFLKGVNDIRIEDLELGEKVESSESLGLPIGLAIALLQDPSGVIQLNPPISGDMEDPSVRVLPIVGKVFMNMIKKAAVSPFALLGGLTGGKKGLETAIFEIGAVALSFDMKGHLESIAKILQERPKLNVNLKAYLNEEREFELFKKAMLFQYSIQRLDGTSEGVSIDPFRAVVEWDDSRYEEVLRTAYLKHLNGVIEHESREGGEVGGRIVESGANVAEESAKVIKRSRSVGSRKRRSRVIKKKVSDSLESIESQQQADQGEGGETTLDRVMESEAVSQLSLVELESELWSISGLELGDGFADQLTTHRVELARAYLTDQLGISQDRVGVVDGYDPSENSSIEFILR